ncbi:ABC transporter substrate-binding protein [Acinetobacter puyangensis]|uniref:ABC transporter substrate-binding protein n=1 Tax=Acinetobacter puyangensis TaxID=1096779 RepID=UPI003A4D75FE
MAHSTRRDFIKHSLLGTSALAFGAGLLQGCDRTTSTEQQQSVNAGNDQPRYGGVLRIGLLGGNQVGNLDVHKPIGTGVQRGFALYSKLWEWDENMAPRLALAESAEANTDATKWTIRLKKGLEFHHGKTITADDVIFSLKRLVDPKLASPFASLLYAVDVNHLKKLDNRTVEIGFRDAQGFVPLPDTWTNFGGIVPTDYDPVSNPVGAGPYKLKEFIPGQRSTFSRFENYFKDGKPYADELQIIDFKDQTSRLLAFQNGQIDLIGNVAAEQYKLLQLDKRIQLIESKTAGWLSFDMNLSKPPFNDPRVVEAFKLLVDREDLIQRALNGLGQVANDLYSPHDPTFNHSIPQRTQDLAKAKALLAEAGYDASKAKPLSVELITTPNSYYQAALILAEQAKQVGVEIKVKYVDAATFNGANRNNFTFSTGSLLAESFLSTALHVDAPVSVANKTHFNDPEFSELFAQALTEPDLEKRKPLVHRAQQIQHEKGGLLIWSFPTVIDAFSTKIGGAVAEQTQFATWRYENLWLK